MSFDDLRPFLKIAAIILGIVVIGVVAKCSFGGSGGALGDGCHDLPMDHINPCLKRVRACGGSEAESRACVAKVMSDLK